MRSSKRPSDTDQPVRMASKELALIERRRHRVTVGYYVEPIAPMWLARTNMRLARLMGADDLWFSDHMRHFLPKAFWAEQSMSRLVPDIDAYFDPMIVIARHCRRRGPRMGTYVTDAIRRTPQDLARAILTLQHTSGNNVVLGIGAGEAMNIEPAGLSTAHMASRLEDALEALRVAFAAEGRFVTHEGRFHSWKDAAFPPPFQGALPPIWVAGQGPKTSYTAGRLGDGWLHVCESLEDFRERAASVAAGAAASGKDVEAMEWSGVMVCVLASNREMFERACASPIVKSGVLCMTGRHWSSVGATHPFGKGFPGVHQLAVSHEDSPFALDSLREGLKAVTPDLIEAMFACGPAEKAAARMSPFVEHGLSHVINTNFAVSVGVSMWADALRETAKLNRLLKRMTPGSRSWSKGEASKLVANDLGFVASAPEGSQLP